MSSRIRSLFVVAALLFGTRQASAELIHGQYRWPGKFMVGARPLGVQVFLNSPAYGTYKFAIDFSGKIVELPKLTIWVGGELNLGGRENLAQIEPGVFVLITLEKLLNIPLVPMVSAGLTFPINVFYAGSNNFTIGGFGVKIGGGAYYFLLKNLGVGGEMHFAFAGGFGGSGLGAGVGSGWLGFWDLVAGVRVAF